VHQQSLERQRLAYLCDNLVSAVAAVLLGVMIVGWVFHEIIEPATLYAWVAVALLVSGWRLYAYFWIKKRLDKPESHAAIEKLLIVTAAATGLIWGAGSILFAMSTDMFYWVFLAFVLSGYASGSVFTTSASLPACAAYFFPTIMPITGWFFLQDEQRAQLMGVLLLVFIAAAWHVARNANRMLLDKYALFAEKAALSDSLEQRNQQLHHEVEERRKTAAELALSHARHQQLLDHAPIGLLVVRHGRVIFSNPYWQQLIQAGDCIDSITQLACADDRSRLSALLESGTEPRTPEPVCWSGPDGRKLHTAVSSLSMAYDGAAATLLLVEDIEPRIQAEAAEHLKYESEAYAQRLAALQTMAGGIAHDFNNLLAAIICNTSLALKQHGAQNPELARIIGRIEEASAQATRLSHQMLAYSGHGAFVVEPLNLSSLVSAMKEQLNCLTDERTSIRYTLNEHIPPLDADSGQIRQMLENLISNASEACHGQAGAVRVSVDCVTIHNSERAGLASHDILQPGDYVSLCIQDTGCGMDAETLRNIFDPFFSTKFTGRGLGMSAVFGIVRSLHGDIRIQSTPHQGTEVQVLLPASRQTKSPVGIPEPARVSQYSGKETVLFVDDEAVLRAAASDMLEAMGYTVITACDGLDALERYAQYGDRIDFIILDLTMPRMGGKACLQALYNINPDVRVILSSGYSMDMISSQLGDHMPAAMLQKPYSVTELEHSIRMLH